MSNLNQDLINAVNESIEQFPKSGPGDTDLILMRLGFVTGHLNERHPDITKAFIALVNKD